VDRPPLPSRRREPWLPALGGLLRDEPDWLYQAASAGPFGKARLRVWQTPEGAMFAVVTETGQGLSVTNAATPIWRWLHCRYGVRVGLAEYWPEGQSGPAHVDLVLPPQKGFPQDWLRLWPVSDGNPHAALMSTWWSVYGDEILAP
jgi:hypothetical protein